MRKRILLLFCIVSNVFVWCGNSFSMEPITEESESSETGYANIFMEGYKDSEGFKSFASQLLEFEDIDKSEGKKETKVWINETVSHFSLLQLVRERQECEKIRQQMLSMISQVDKNLESDLNQIQRISSMKRLYDTEIYVLELMDERIERDINKPACKVFQYIAKIDFSQDTYSNLLAKISGFDIAVLEKISHMCFEKKDKLKNVLKEIDNNCKENENENIRVFCNKVNDYEFLLQICMLKIKLERMDFEINSQENIDTVEKFMCQFYHEYNELSRFSLMKWWKITYNSTELKDQKNKSLESEVPLKQQRRSFGNLKDFGKRKSRFLVKRSRSDETVLPLHNNSFNPKMLAFLDGMKIGYLKKWINYKIGDAKPSLIEEIRAEIQHKFTKKEKNNFVLDQIYRYLIIYPNFYNDSFSGENK